MDFVFCICDKIINLFIFIWDILTDNDMKGIELGLTTWGCYIAYRALSTWRDQIIETPKINLAREMIESFYDMQDLMYLARSNMISFSPDMVREFYGKKDYTEYQCGLAYRLMILDKSDDKLQKFQELRNKAKIFYSKEIENCFFEVNKIINLFRQACKEMINSRLDEDIDIGNRESLLKEYSEILYNTGKNDVINMKLNKIIAEVEYNLRPIYETKMIKWKKLKSQKQRNQTNG